MYDECPLKTREGFGLSFVCFIPECVTLCMFYVCVGSYLGREVEDRRRVGEVVGLRPEVARVRRSRGAKPRRGSDGESSSDPRDSVRQGPSSCPCHMGSGKLRSGCALEEPVVLRRPASVVGEGKGKGWATVGSREANPSRRGTRNIF